MTVPLQVAGQPAVRASLAPLLHDSLAGWDELDARYHSLLELVRGMLGVVPNCDRYLEVWPAASRTYNVMVPNLLNLPVPVFGLGGPRPGVVGLAMYAASRTARCAYCSAHSCSFAVRRGADPEKIAAALHPHRASLDPGELTAVTVATSLSSIPGGLTPADKAALVDAFGARNAEWIVLSVAMMGFLNKFMDTIGVEVEQSLVSEVSDLLGPAWTPGVAGASLDADAPRLPLPPADSLRSRLRLVPLLPAAVRYDRSAQRGTPRGRAAVSRHLVQTTGHDFPVLAALRSGRARRAIATMITANLDPATSAIGIPAKVLAGTIYATVVDDTRLTASMAALAARAGVAPAQLTAAAPYARGAEPAPDAPTALLLARAAATSPAEIDAGTVEACARDLSPAAIVEIVTWLSVLQLLHRLNCYIWPTR